MYSQSIEKYIEYLENCPIDQLKCLFNNIDHERFPDRSQLLKKRIAFLEDPENKDSTSDKNGFYHRWISKRPAWYLDKIQWSNLVIGLSVPLALLALLKAVGGLDYFRYRPWVALPTYYIFYFVLTLFLCAFSVASIKKNKLNPGLRLRPPKYLIAEFFKSILFLFLINIIVGILALVLIKAFKITPEKTALIKIASFAPNSWHLLLLLIYAVTIGPVVEEVYFRGYFYNALKTRLSLSLSIFLQALIFSLAHFYDAFNGFLVFLVGMALAVIYEKRNNLFSPIVIHVFRNAFILVPFIFLVNSNMHTPAPSFELAETDPFWLASSPPSYVEKQASGQEQYEYAIETWGEKGSRQWKKAANALRAVSYWFPGDKHSASKAVLEIAYIFQGCLHDHRRAITVSKSLISSFPDQESQRAAALSIMGWSYYMLKDFTNSRAAFEEIISNYTGNNNILNSANKGIEWINKVK